ncbi:MAG: ABC transporter substrate-binding protein [Tagaea sp.]|nr:ABC transporter substrate-binding protein [Tagaea sp.]
MTRKPLSRRATLGLLGAGTALATLPAPALRAQNLDKFVYQTNWRAQAEHGGFYQALATGIYRRHGIDAEIRMGGPQQDPNALLVAGRVDAIMSNSFSGFRYVEENVPFVVVASVMQKDPQVLISHPGVGNDTLPQLRGKPILIGAGGRSSYWPWLRAKFQFTDEQVRPYTFNMAPFLADRTLSQQGFLTSEPFDIRKAGVNPVIHLLAEYGFENYQTTINTSVRMVREKPDLLQRFVNASIEGWYGYLKGDPSAANALIKRDNPDMPDDKIAHSISELNKYGIVDSGDSTRLGIGAMTDARWKSFYDAMAGAGVVRQGLDISRAYTLQFVNKRVGMG